jgi:hypothetical protein
MDKINRYIYLASPYSHNDPATRESRFERVTEIAGKLEQEGWIVFSPITHSHPVAIRCSLPKGWKFWGEIDKVFIYHCLFVAILMLPGWKESEGIKEEIKLAKEYKKPIVYLTPDGNWYYPRTR